MQLADYRTALKTAISSESKAYGFSLVVWGTASMVTSDRGLPGRAGTVAYLGGLLAGVSVAILLALGGPASTWSPTSPRRYSAGVIHLVSVAVAVGAGWGVAMIVEAHWQAYLLAGGVAGLAHQLVLGLEVAVTTASEDGDEPPKRGLTDAPRR